MRDVQYGLAWGLFGFAFSLAVDMPAWKLCASIIAVGTGFALLASWLRTAE